MLVYLGITSRVLERPMNEGIIAPSAAGKNHAVDIALPLFPSEAFLVIDAASPRSLIYSTEDLRHRVVIFSEADSIPKDDSTAASALRTLATKQELAYDVTEKDESGKFVTRRIVREGPTGLITTSTRAFDEQWSTRMLQFGVDDTEERTRRVMAAHASAVNGFRPKPDYSSFVALQTWLALAGDHEVTVPFGHALVKLIPASLIRMRRDFRQLLTAIQSVALLHQRQRDRDEIGRVIATLEDYQIARELLLDAFTQTATGGVSREIREVVHAVAELAGSQKTPVTKKQVADLIRLSPAGAWYRLGKAIDLGYIINQETRTRQPSKLVIGDPLPEEKPALPTVEEVESWMAEDAAPETDRIVETPEASNCLELRNDSEADSMGTESVRESPLEDEPDSDKLLEHSAIQRFSRYPDSPTPTVPDDLTREEVLKLAALQGWPELKISPAETQIAGEEAGRKFTSRATQERLLLTRRALEGCNGR
jgi:hypothetical protein